MPQRGHVKELMGQNLAEEVAEGQRMEQDRCGQMLHLLCSEIWGLYSYLSQHAQALQRELAHERAMAKEADLDGEQPSARKRLVQW